MFFTGEQTMLSQLNFGNHLMYDIDQIFLYKCLRFCIQGILLIPLMRQQPETHSQRKRKLTNRLTLICFFFHNLVFVNKNMKFYIIEYFFRFIEAYCC